MVNVGKYTIHGWYGIVHQKSRQSDVPYGVLLSGGLDSSLVASIMSRNSQRFPRFELDGMGVVEKNGQKGIGSEIVGNF